MESLLRYPGTVKLADVWKVNIDILVPFRWLIFGKVGLGYPCTRVLDDVLRVSLDILKLA